MCELLAMSTLQAAHLTFSLEALASHSGISCSNRDGWGAAFYQGHDVALFREPVAASESPLVRLLTQQGPATTLAISHIRRATLGVVSLANTQPFVRELAGRMHTFAHNGHLPGIAASPTLAFDRYRPVGDTDSEHAVVTQFAAVLRPLGPANFLYSDGEFLYAHGHRRIHPATGRIEPPGLYWLSQHCSPAASPLMAQGVVVLPELQAVTLIASVPLSSADWKPFAEGEIVVVSAGVVITRVV
ncbi:MAG: class II glutamine amidotransferase [Polaromonas sp. 28-63-22]|nr:MAG: class II glutamine amidotransferase [Polaromonas sp. 28-63-22]